MLKLFKIYQASPDTQRIWTMLKQIKQYCICYDCSTATTYCLIYNIPEFKKTFKVYYTPATDTAQRIEIYRNMEEHK